MLGPEKRGWVNHLTLLTLFFVFSKLTVHGIGHVERHARCRNGGSGAS